MILNELPPPFWTVFSSKIFEVFFLFPVRGEKRKKDFFRKNTCEAGLASTIQKLKSQIFFIQCPINVSDSTMIQRKVSDEKYLKVDPGILRMRRAQCPSFDAYQW